MHATGEKLGVLNTLDDLILASVQTFITSLTSSCMLHFIVAYIWIIFDENLGLRITISFIACECFSKINSHMDLYLLHKKVDYKWR